MTDNTLDKEIATIRKLIFEYSPDDIETRLRQAVVYIRADEVPLPKKVWTDLIEDIFKDKLAQETKKAEVRGAKKFFQDLPFSIQAKIANGAIDKFAEKLQKQSGGGK